MPKSRKTRKTSNWADKQKRDQFVKKARSQGYRARSAFKLEEIDKKYRLIKPHFKVVDLGCAPGSWCQYVATKINSAGQIVGVDLLEMNEIKNVQFIQGDFTDPEIQQNLHSLIKQDHVDLVLSDMAPNITGIRITDQANAEYLQDAILSYTVNSLIKGGNLFTKIFEGESAKLIQKKYAEYFEKVQVIKPEASRAESKEIFLLAKHFKGNYLNNEIAVER